MRAISRSTLTALTSVGLWQIGNYLIPLLLVPYLARALGIESFGLLALGTAVAAYPILLTDWGFMFTATRQISIVRDDPEQVSRIIWSVLLAKLVLASVSCLVLALGIAFLVPDALTRAVLFASMVNVLGGLFSLDWVLRGVEQFSRFSLASILGRLLAIPATIALVQQPDDVVYAVLTLALGGILVAGLSVVMCWRLNLIAAPPPLATMARDALGHVRAGGNIFLSTLASSVYTRGLFVVLALFNSPYAVGLFSGADKIQRPVINLLSPILIVAFPKISATAVNDPEQARRNAFKVTYVQGAAGLLLAALLFVTAPLVVDILLGAEFADVVPVLRVMAVAVVLISLSGALGQTVMLPLGLNAPFRNAYLIGSVAGVVLAVPLCAWYGAMGAAVTTLIVEAIVTLSMFISLGLELSWFGAARKPSSHA